MQNKQVKKLLTMNIQKFAEGGADAGSGTDVGGSTEGGNEGGQPTVEELLAKITQLETDKTKLGAEADKWKASFDKASNEAAENKRQLRARMSAQEQADTAKQEAEEAQQQLLASLQKQVADLQREKLIGERKAFFMSEGVGMDSTLADEIANAQVNGDWAKFDAGLKKHINSVKEHVRVSVLGERGATHAGNGVDDQDPTIEMAKRVSARKAGTVNTDILKHYM